MSEAIDAREWAGEMGERWLASLDAFEGMLQTVGEASLAHAGFRPGQRVIDIGCGGGWTTRQIARAVSPGGSVLGLDISASLVAEARRRAEREGLANIGFVALDAASSVPPATPFERLYSRFGSMFFPEPARAFTNLHFMLGAGGRADFAVWAPPARNPWVGEVLAIVRQYIDMPPPEPHAPGPFALDDPDYFRGLLEGAGFSQVDFHLWEGEQLVGGPGRDAAGATDFVLTNTHFADALREAPQDVQGRVREQVTRLFEPYRKARGVSLPAAAWFVSARRS